MRQRIQWGVILLIAGAAIMALCLYRGHGRHGDAPQGFLIGFLIGFLGVVFFGVLSRRLGSGLWRMKLWMWSRRFL